LYTKDNSIGTISVSSFANESEQIVDNPEKRKAQQKGDFIYKVDDMLAILFPHMYEDLEYLLPSTEEPGVGQSALVDVEMVDGTSRSSRGGIELNAVAGPSRRPY
jgi:E3 ubiquitin-protein ligase SHPRH